MVVCQLFPAAMRAALGLGMTARRFPPPWSVEETDPKLARQCFIVRDVNGQALAYVYFEEEPGWRPSCSRASLRGLFSRKDCEKMQ